MYFGADEGGGEGREGGRPDLDASTRGMIAAASAHHTAQRRLANRHGSLRPGVFLRNETRVRPSRSAGAVKGGRVWRWGGWPDRHQSEAQKESLTRVDTHAALHHVRVAGCAEKAGAGGMANITIYSAASGWRKANALLAAMKEPSMPTCVFLERAQNFAFGVMNVRNGGTHTHTKPHTHWKVKCT